MYHYIIILFVTTIVAINYTNTTSISNRSTKQITSTISKIIGRSTSHSITNSSVTTVTNNISTTTTQPTMILPGVDPFLPGVEPFDIASPDMFGAESFRSPLDVNSLFEPSSHVDSSAMPPCAVSCTSHLMNVVPFVFKIDDAIERYRLVCDKYDKSQQCMNKLKHCPGNLMFAATTSGLKYMCVEERKNFEPAVPCIANYSAEVQSECEHKCSVHSLISKMALNSDMSQRSSLGQIDPTFMKQYLGDVCSAAQCSLNCVKSLYNGYCAGGNVGTMLAEVVLRPLLESHKMFDISPISIGALLSSYLPEQCHFVLEKSELERLRDPDESNERLPQINSHQIVSNENEPSHQQETEDDIQLDSLLHEGVIPQINSPLEPENAQKSSINFGLTKNTFNVYRLFPQRWVHTSIPFKSIVSRNDSP